MSFPNTLTIFINTRIRGYPKIKFEPDMIVPNIKSETVYFNPLIKLNKSVSLKIPSGYPLSERFTQFFNKSDFNGLVGRNVAYGFQKKLTLEEATQNGIVDNNINVTLDILFKKYNKFYIKGKPYTIFSHEWINGDWQIDKKSFEKQILSLPYGQGLYGIQQNFALENRLAEDELQKFKKEHSGIASGFAVSTDFSKFKDEYESGVARGITPKKPASSEKEDAARKLAEEEAKLGIPKAAHRLATKKLIYQPIINLDDEASLSNDPVSLNIIYSIDRNYSEDINLNKKLLEPLYQTLLKKGDEYRIAKEEYDKSIGTYFALVSSSNTIPTPIATPVEESSGVPQAKATIVESNDVFKNKKIYDEAVEKINTAIDNYKAQGLIIQNVTPQIKNNLIQIIAMLEKYKMQFLNSFLESLKLLAKKINAQINYIRALYSFYANLYVTKEAHYKSENSEKEYQNILMLNIIKFDMQCYKNIVNNFESSEPKPLADNFKTLISKIPYVENFIKRNNAIPKNYNDLLVQYYNHPGLLLINRYNFDIYMFSLLQFDFIIDLGVWKILYKQTDLFLDSIKYNLIGTNNGTEIVEGKMAMAGILLNKYNNTYSKARRDSFKKDVSKLKTPIQKQNSHMLDFAFPESTSLKQQKNDYIQLQTAITLCYDLITLYSRISAIKYSREISLISSRQNLGNVLSKIYTRKNNSYSQILADNAMIPFIPNYLFWDSQTYIDSRTLNNSIKINLNAKQINKSKQQNYKQLMNSLRTKYHEAVEILIPEISKLGILQKCEELIDEEDDSDDDDSDVESVFEDDGSPLTPGEKIKMSVQKNMERFFDQDNTLILQEQLSYLYDEALRDDCLQHRLNERDLSLIVSGWSVINNPGGGDCLFYAISTLFNNELINNGQKSNNVFAEPTGYYSYKSLRRAITDPTYGIQPDDTDGWNVGLRPQIEHIDMDDEHADPNDRRMRREYSFLFDDRGNWIGNNIDALRNVMRTGTRYWGDDIAINILERIFKVKFIVIDTNPIQQHPFPKGINVRFLNHANDETFGVITNYLHDPATNDYLYEIEDSSYITHLEISGRDNLVIPSENRYYRVAPTVSDPGNADEFSQFAFILLTIEPTSGAQHYEIMYSKRENKFIYSFDDIPDGLKYLIFKTQWKFLHPANRLNTWFGHNREFRQRFELYQERYEHKVENSPERRRNIRNGIPPDQASTGPRRVPRRGPIIGGQISNKNRYVSVYNTNNPRFDDSKLSYYVIIDLELYPGESIPLLKQPVIACSVKYEKIRQAFADMFGLAYHPREFYQRGHVAPSSVKYRKEGESREDENRNRFNNNYGYRPPINTRRFHVSYNGGKKTRRIR